LELDSLSGEAYVVKAFLHLNLFEYEIAEEAILKAIELSPNYARAHHSYSYMLNLLARPEEALAQIRMAAELDPKAPIIQVRLANSTWYVGRAEEALTLLRRNIERNPEFPNNYWSMANYQTALGNLGVAQRWYEEARKRNPKAGSNLWRDQCIGLLNLGDILAAEDCINQYGEISPTSDWLWYQVHVYKGEWKAAILIRESILKADPNSRGATWVLADLIAGQGDVERARRMMADRFPEYLEGGLEVTAKNLREALIFAAIHHANGETQQRDVLLLAMEKRMATMHRIRGYGYGAFDVYIHAMRGDRDQAIAGLREAIEMGWRAVIPPRLRSWWTLRQDWKLGSLLQDPEFIVLMNELEADLHAQRQWYEENKDKPLF
jgi:tetratricopeptide (TPR) repeat protein